jgi:hypothetical protein
MSRQTFNIANPIYIVNKSADVDSRYGPWSSLQDANNNVNVNIREIGLTVGVSAVGFGVTEYWYKNGTQNGDLILKTAGGGGGGTIELPLSGNWNSVYSNVNQNSALWNGFNSYTTTFPISTVNGALILNTSANNVFFRAVNTGQLFSYTNFTTGKTIIVYLSASHAGDIIHQFPVQTYFNGVGESNYLLTYEGKVTKATITNIENNFYGFAELVQTQYLSQSIPANINDNNIILDGYIGFLLQEDGGRLILDEFQFNPQSQICVQTPNPFANGTYQFSGYFKGRPRYSQFQNGNEVIWDSLFSVNRWAINSGGGLPYYASSGDTYFPTDATWSSGVTVSNGAC